MRYIALAAVMLLAACNPPPPSYGYGPDPIEMMIVGRMMNPQPTYQMQTPIICNRLGNQTVCN